MITVRLIGGLGNQMFQYAAARALAQRHNTKVILDLTWFDQKFDKNTTPRHYELDAFNLDTTSIKYTGTFPQKVIRKLLQPSIYNEPHFHFSNRFEKLPNNIRLEGYFQSEKYFKNIRSTLLEDFTWCTPASSQNQKLLNAIMSDDQSVSVHVRRGDYITNKSAKSFHGLTPIQYYKKAMAIMASKIKSPNLYIFSDDPKWCKSNLRFDHPTVYISHNTQGVEDMRLMKSCRHNIIANSSFSWWGAWLNENNQKIVIGPKAWFAHKESDTKDIIPKTWLEI